MGSRSCAQGTRRAPSHSPFLRKSSQEPECLRPVMQSSLVLTPKGCRAVPSWGATTRQRPVGSPQPEAWPGSRGDQRRSCQAGGASNAPFASAVLRC